ncbi:ER membrane protein complex subunit 4 [Spathaspora sp. JA1]|nr:ER membrane protein complex subunit 4 [Spathaspora sp. JA1]
MDYSEIVNPTIVIPSKQTIRSPPGSDISNITTNTSSITAPKKHDINLLKTKKAYSLANGPAKSIPMNLIMSYFTGNSLQIIPMSMTLMLLLNPLKSIIYDTNSTFSKLTTEENKQDILICKLLFILFQLANMAIGVYKLYNMGLIPHKEADWLAWKEGVEFIERLSNSS